MPPVPTNNLLLLPANSHPNISFVTNPTMPSLLLLIILLLSLSISACDGRHLSVHDKDSNRVFRHYSSKDATVAKLDGKTSPQVKQFQTSSEKEIPSSAAMERPKSLEASTKDAVAKRDEVAGSEVLIMPSCHAGLLQTAQSEVRSGRPERSLLEYESNDVTIGTSETRAVMDLVAMDYPESRRGPSIHNK